jgi:5-methylcytosine-specific restriction endonuclease McrA
MTETREQRRERWARWYASAKADPAWRERRKIAKAKWRAENQESVKASNRKSLPKRREQLRANWKRFYLRHHEAELLRSLDYRKSHPEKRRASVKDYSQRKPWVATQKEGKRRARKRQTQTGPVDYEAIIRDSCGLCGICGEAVIGEPAHIDHIVPLARGGSHTQGNLQFTHARCNLSKGAKLLKAG